MAILKYEDGTFGISADQVWRPGIYESEKACRIAQKRSDSRLNALQQIANLRAPDGRGVITEQDLRDDRPAICQPEGDE